jgi:hypothetical protein
MSLSEDGEDVSEQEAARARRTAAVTQAAAAYMSKQRSSLKGRYGDMHSSSQVLLLEDDELWDTLAVNWCVPGKEKIASIVNTWEGIDLDACVYRLGLNVLYPQPNYQKKMRRAVIEAVKAYAKKHPELFKDDAEPEPSEEEEQEEDAGEVPRTRTPPRAASAAPSPKQDRRSPRNLPSSR